MRTALLLTALTLISAGLLAGQVAHAKNLYKWVDENGNIYFSDQVPPEHSQYGRQTLNEKGRVVNTLEQAKTKEQQELDKRLQKLRAEQQKIIGEQKSHDKVLLSTFRSEADMKAMLAGKLQSLDAQGGVLQGNLKRLENLLDGKHKKAAVFERNGQKIPKGVLDEIKTIEGQIADAKAEIGNHQAKRAEVEANFEADMERYRFLTQSEGQGQAQNLSDKTAQIKAADELGLYDCSNDTDCAKAWAIARRFIDQYSTTGNDVANDKLILSRAPVNTNDLSLSVSKVQARDNHQQLFLDIRCQQSSAGDELCAGEKVKAIRKSFRSYIEQGLAADQ